MEISVVIPAYNAAEHLAATLSSVAAQSHAAAEVIVVDDGSTDATASIATVAGAIVVRQPNSGVSAARNAGVRATRSPWVAFLDADDRWRPTFLERISAAAHLCPDLAALFTDYALDDPTAPPCPSWFAADASYRLLPGREIAPGVRRFARDELTRALVRSRAFISTSAFAVRRKAFVTSGGFDESLRRAEDLEFMLRLFGRGTAAAIAEPLSVYRRHGGGLTADEAACVKDERRVWRSVIANPDRYSYALARELADALPARIRADGITALAGGRFADAVADLLESAKLGDGFAACIYPIANVLNTPLGRAWYPRMHSTLKSLRSFAEPRASSP